VQPLLEARGRRLVLAVARRERTARCEDEETRCAQEGDSTAQAHDSVVEGRGHSSVVAGLGAAEGSAGAAGFAVAAGGVDEGDCGIDGCGGPCDVATAPVFGARGSPTTDAVATAID
jgi:hypothetical protein